MSNQFSPNKKSYGAGHGRYVLCKAVNRKDPEQSGRVQVRVFGWQEDKGLIPDEDLIWARPLNAVTSPMSGGIGGPVTGAIDKEGEETWFWASYSDGDQQLMLHHTVHRGGKDNGNGELDQSGRNSDVPPHTRDPDKGGGDYRFDRDENQFQTVSLPKYGKDESENPYGRTVSKDAAENPSQSWSLGMYIYS